MRTFEEIAQDSYSFDQSNYNTDWRWQLLEELYTRNYLAQPFKSSPTVGVLPKKIHQIWLGSEIPEKYKRWGETWKQLHPDWEYCLWTDKDVDELTTLNKDIYNTIGHVGAKSDILRYSILYEQGGIYVDTDFECLKSFDSLRYLTFFTGVGYPKDIELYVGIIACTPKHPIMGKVIETVRYITNEKIAQDVLSATSSYMFTKCFFEMVNSYQENIVVFPTDYFYPFPNERGHEFRDGHDYIKDCSLAVHHWEVSWGFKNFGRDWIQGDKFKHIADSIYAPIKTHQDDYDHLKMSFDPSNLKRGVNIVYTHPFYVKQLFSILQYLAGRFIVITHNGDENIDDSYIIPDNVIKWYAQNVNATNPKIQSIPIGLENNRWSNRNGKQLQMIEQLKKPRRYIRLVYMNHDVKTNPDERAVLYELFEGKKWVTAIRGKNGEKIADYFYNLYNHKFVICPNGNGMDTHRVWETLYLHTIPIMKRDINNQFYTDLPICFVNDWSEITEDFLNSEYARIKAGSWNLAKLNFEYWRSKILAR
jgi:inositol phosphorylceramide mannosyltransferase catalytic subunit